MEEAGAERVVMEGLEVGEVAEVGPQEPSVGIVGEGVKGGQEVLEGGTVAEREEDAVEGVVKVEVVAVMMEVHSGGKGEGTNVDASQTSYWR